MGIWGQETQYFYELSPEAILDDLESLGFETGPHILPLNSMENRVHEIRQDDGPGLVVKHYRPGRWSPDQIQEELSFLDELAKNDCPVLPALKREGKNLFKGNKSDLYFAVFPKKSGRLKDEYTPEECGRLGRAIGRIHLVGKKSSFQHRLKFDLETLVINNWSYLKASDFIGPEWIPAFEKEINQFVEARRLALEQLETQRIHGDFHLGNLLWRDDELLIVDLDDALNGPVGQDFWMLWDLFGADPKCTDEFIDGYEMFTEFPVFNERWVATFRFMRLIHYYTWVSKRYQDPSFSRAFPLWKEDRNWNELFHQLRELNIKLSEIEF